MSITIVIPSRLTDQTVLSFPVELLEDYIVDASALTFVEPMGIVQLILLLHHVASIGGQVTFIAPNGYEPDHYLARMAFYDHVPESVLLQHAIDPSTVKRKGSCDVLIPVKAFRTDYDVEEIVEDVAKFLQRMLGNRLIPGPLYSSLLAAVPELAGNAA